MNGLAKDSGILYSRTDKTRCISCSAISFHTVLCYSSPSIKAMAKYIPMVFACSSTGSLVSSLMGYCYFRKIWCHNRRYRIPLSFATCGRIYKIKDTIDPNCDPYQGWQKHRVHETLEVELKSALHNVFTALHVQHVPRSCNLDNIDQNMKGGPLLLERFASTGLLEINGTLRCISENKNVFKSCFKCGESFDSDEDVTVSLNDIFEYFLSQRDDDPLYIFDHQFTERCSLICKDYQDMFNVEMENGPSSLRQALFPEDLMSKMSERPPHKWLLVGPQGSGTHIHQDPRGTTAWNALFHGVKIWTFFHPRLSADDVRSGDKYWSGEQASSYWFINYLPGAIKRCGAENVKIAIQMPGDVIIVPPSWWHCVVNAEDTIAVTENGVSVNSFCKEMMMEMDSVNRTAGKESLCPAL